MSHFIMNMVQQSNYICGLKFVKKKQNMKLFPFIGVTQNHKKKKQT